LGYDSGMTCWRRLRDWQAADVWDRLHALLLAESRAAGRLELARAIADSSHVRDLKGGPQRGPASGPSPVDRGRAGSKHHVLTDAGGIPLPITLTGCNRNDVTQLLSLLDAIPPIRGRVGRGIRPVIARRGTPHGSGLGRWRWPVERTLAWLHQVRRPRVRRERRADIHQGFLKLAVCLISWRCLQRSFG
jgi:transposase